MRRIVFEKPERSSTVLRMILEDGKTQKSICYSTRFLKQCGFHIGTVKQTLSFYLETDSRQSRHQCLLGPPVLTAARQGMPRLDREFELSPAMGGDVPQLEARAKD